MVGRKGMNSRIMCVRARESILSVGNGSEKEEHRIYRIFQDISGLGTGIRDRIFQTDKKDWTFESQGGVLVKKL